MKAAQISQYGHADQIMLRELVKPKPSKDQVLIEVHAASLNPFDSTVREGHVSKMMPLVLPVTLGGDVAGVVTKLGANVTGLAVGDRVYGQASVMGGGSGSLAEYAVTRASQVAVLPAGLDFVQGAALPLTGQSALQVISGHMKLDVGQKILIHGGAGGIGTMAIQLAKHIGAYVATTATGDGLAYVKELGADKVIDYQTQDFAKLVSDYDAVFDTVGGETYTRSFAVLKRGGIIVSMLVQPNVELARKHGVVAIAQQTKTTTESLTELANLAERGVLSTHVERVFPLTEVVPAFEAREAGNIRGKIVVKIRD
jgi:NADPH:quinone reductase-like Zn-dependent oxidoreductase